MNRYTGSHSSSMASIFLKLYLILQSEKHQRKDPGNLHFRDHFFDVAAFQLFPLQPDEIFLCHSEGDFLLPHVVRSDLHAAVSFSISASDIESTLTASQRKP